MVRRVAGGATDVISCVLGVDRVHVLRAAGVAGKAARVDFWGRGVLKPENLRFVATAVDVGLARTVTPLAALPPRAFLGIERGYEVW